MPPLSARLRIARSLSSVLRLLGCFLSCLVPSLCAEFFAVKWIFPPIPSSAFLPSVLFSPHRFATTSLSLLPHFHCLLLCRRVVISCSPGSRPHCQYVCAVGLRASVLRGASHPFSLAIASSVQAALLFMRVLSHPTGAPYSTRSWPPASFLFAPFFHFTCSRISDFPAFLSLFSVGTFFHTALASFALSLRRGFSPTWSTGAAPSLLRPSMVIRLSRSSGRFLSFPSRTHCSCSSSPCASFVGLLAWFTAARLVYCLRFLFPADWALLLPYLAGALLCLHPLFGLVFRAPT